MNNKVLAYCYRSYYSIVVYPAGGGQARISTCCLNAFRPENKLIIEKNIKDVWNSNQFQFQRKLISKKDWSFCWGADCSVYPFLPELKIIEDHHVKDAIATKRTKLDYFARNIIISPSFACNNNCYFCFKASKHSYQLQDSLIKEIKEDIVPLVDWIVLSGGEPFFASVSRELIDWIISHYPEKKLLVVTNGTLLHQFGLEKIMQNNIALRVSMYGMSPKTYYEVTGTDNFDAMYNNVCALIKAGYKHIQFAYIVSRKPAGDLEDFCKFIEKHRDITGTVRNNFFEGTRNYKTMEYFKRRFSHLPSRLKFQYQGRAIPQNIVCRFYNPLHSLRYSYWKSSSKDRIFGLRSCGDC